jgi:hypothetical protein
MRVSLRPMDRARRDTRVDKIFDQAWLVSDAALPILRWTLLERARLV